MKLTEHQQQLAADNIGLVYAVIAAMRRRRHRSIFILGQDDAIAAGMLGLCVAAGRYDPQRNIRFSTYAWIWIRHNIQEASAKAVVITNPRSVFDGDKTNKCRYVKVHSQGSYNVDITSQQTTESYEHLVDVRMDFESIVERLDNPNYRLILRQVRDCCGNITSAAKLRGVTSQRAQQIYTEAVQEIRKQHGLHIRLNKKKRIKKKRSKV